jgi:hypothetical protein
VIALVIQSDPGRSLKAELLNLANGEVHASFALAEDPHCPGYYSATLAAVPVDGLYAYRVLDGAGLLIPNGIGLIPVVGGDDGSGGVPSVDFAYPNGAIVRFYGVKQIKGGAA